MAEAFTAEAAAAVTADPPKERIMKVGFIGLGHMGAGMAANLLKAGHELTVFNRTSSRVQALVERGARAAPQ